MKTKYFLIFVLAVLILYDRIPGAVTAAQAGADRNFPKAAMEERADSAAVCADYAGTGYDRGNIGIEENGTMEEGIYLLARGETEEIHDRGIPLAALSSDTTSGRFSWRGFLLGFLALVILGVGIWAVSRSRNEKKNRK